MTASKILQWGVVSCFPPPPPPSSHYESSAYDYKGNQEMHFWICTNKDVIPALKLLLILSMAFTKENITTSTIFVHFQWHRCD